MQLGSARGFNLVELMVAMVAGLLLVAAVISLFATVLKADQTAMQTSRLNQELQSITDQIARDIQRAGYDACAVIYLAPSGAHPACYSSPSSGVRSPFYFDSTIDLASNCIRVRYDENDNGGIVSDANEARVYSYRADKSVWLVEPAAVSAPVATLSECTSGGNRISDDNTIEVTNLTFTMLSGSVSTGARAIQLNISGQYKDNTALKLNLQRDIKLRNDGY